MNIRKYLPENKHDFESVNVLKTLDKDELKEILPELFEWLQDGNWPISHSIENILLRFDEELIPHIHKVLQTNDGQWKYFLLEGLVNRLPNSILIQLREDLIRIINDPTKDEELEELGNTAANLLNKIRD
ncbi:DUF5071 domain-containing protein [Paenibacillus sp. J22TS3]|uniref:DUF5071 domain-containing protein n=1 Tax=Paenibacillus sp. J22TS3 TaxID=2807192 RepID=UPI001B20990D|nr:DUF5071 domain-containing protein [Paenibacillus sp. J22TS3]GIP20618.1 hypothetical protein J22TS3_08930 [Paenibacillus sp. J22TS3]